MAWAASDLVNALRRQVLGLETDLRARVDGSDPDARQADVYEAWRTDYDAAFAARRTAATWQEWRNDRVTQAAVAWVLLTVFARYCEDNALLSLRWIGGADADERTQAIDARRAYFQAHPEYTDREWLGQIIDHFAAYRATAGLVDRYSPLHLVAPSGDAARALLEFWWQQDGDGQPLYPFTGVDTRFLGDVYQDLSEHAKKTYALLQTPEFVEEFILDQTMEPALADRPLEGFTVIDPTCGSGHFLLGAFHRLHERWQREAPGLGARELVEKALDGVYGVDINPFAVAIARFRLLVAALRAAGDTSIEQKIGYQPHLAAGDSLRWGARQQTFDDNAIATERGTADATEDVSTLNDILQRQHDVVVGNPPYITVKDAALNGTYRQLYRTTHRKYALTVPFMELFFHLAYSSGSSRPAGWVGEITSNSFMKREFGSKLIEEFLPTVDIHEIIDTSGAYIPGHGTPTVIMVGRNRGSSTPTIRAVLGIRGEPGRPAEPAKGLVWSTITQHIHQPGYEDAYVSVADLPRDGFRTHPWSLSGGGAVELTALVDTRTSDRLGTHVNRIGFFGVMGADDAFSMPIFDFSQSRFDESAYPPLIQGDDVRDFSANPRVRAFFPYDQSHKLISLSAFPREAKYLWPLRTELGNRATFSRGTYFSDGRPWYEWHQLPTDGDASSLSITFAEVATHNHFVLDRGGKVFKQTAPVVKLPGGASIEDHLRLLGVLNSSVACFWLKQNCYPKGGDPIGQDGARVSAEGWSDRYQFNGTTLKDFPLPERTPVQRPQRLDELAHGLRHSSPAELATNQVPTADILDWARTESESLRALMIAHQEELDWEYYRIYGLIDDDLTYSGDAPEITLGKRAFEIALARRMKDGDDTAWFERHGSTPLTEIPDHLPADYRELLQRRLDAMESNPHIRLLERPEYKRRWATEPWDKQVESALRGWLLDRVEDSSLWFDREGRPQTQSVAQLADVLDRDEDFRRVLRLWTGDLNVATGNALAKLLADETVPFLAAYRYKTSGLDKRAAWEETWALQRREDNGEKLDGPIPVPPKYKPTDFAKPSYWSHRGKLDVPKERFISYPNAGRDTDPTGLLGWAGWHHAEQALALASLVSHRIEDGWGAPKLIPLLAGLAEQQPWVRQWHNQIDPEYGESVADTIDDELTARCNELHLAVTDLTSWRPEPARRGRRTRA